MHLRLFVYYCRGPDNQDNCAELAHAANPDFHARNKNSAIGEDNKKHSKKKKASFGFVGIIPYC